MSNNKENKQNTRDKQFHVRINSSTKDLLEQRAKDEHISQGDVLNKALVMYLTKDIMDESLLIAKMTEILRQVGYIQKRIEIQEKLTLEFYQYFFLFSPTLPSDKNELAALSSKANSDVQQFLFKFKKRVEKIKPLIETIFGDMLEEDTGDNA